MDQSKDPTKVFPQSVASGDPQPRGIVLWTRIDSKVVQSGQDKIKVAYEISDDENFDNVILQGVVQTGKGRDHTVKTQLNDKSELNPFTIYYYRFIYQRTASKTGRFKTLPSPDQDLDRLRFGYTSCQDYTNGYYNALRYMADEKDPDTGEELDYVVHVGDYIYETVADETFQGGGPPERQFTLPSGRNRAETLKDYRFLYKKYKSDEDLQYLHERYATINIWDDHEFANDCYQVYDSDTDNEQANRDPQRRQAANRAWAEYVPAGVPYQPKKGPLEEIHIYRSFEFGNLAELVMTDERLYRDGPPCGLKTTDKYFAPGCGDEKAPGRTMFGKTQKQWFLDRVTNSERLWKFWGNEVMMMQLKVQNTYKDQLPPAAQDKFPSNGDGVYVNLDQWDGYQAEREEILKTMKDKGVKNFVALTGDLHSFAAGYLRVDFDDLTPPQTDAVGACFMASSVTSANLSEILTRIGYLGPGVTDLGPIMKGSNPHLEFFNSDTHGYNVMTVRTISPASWYR